MTNSVLYEVSGGVATITLNRPDAMNSLTTEMKIILRRRLDHARDDDAVRAVLITAAGRAFCAGQDLREHAESLDAGGGADTVREHYNPLVRALAALDKPIVAAVQGVAAGAGASLALACDFRVASERASFLLAFAKVGFGPDTGASWTLQRLVGRAKATELLMLAEPVDAARAHAMGLVNSLVTADQLPTAARTLAERLAAGPTRAYGAIRRALDFAATHSLDESLEKEAELQSLLAQTADHKNATMAFVRKQTPVFTGR